MYRRELGDPPFGQGYIAGLSYLPYSFDDNGHEWVFIIPQKPIP